MAIFAIISWVNPFGKNVNFWTFWTGCFYSLERRFFVLEYHKRHFPDLHCLKKKSWKNGHFWTKTMRYSLWKNVSFSTFWSCCFYSLERRFFVVEYHEAIFLADIAQKKNLEQWPFLHQIHGSIFGLVELVVFIA